MLNMFSCNSTDLMDDLLCVVEKEGAEQDETTIHGHGIHT